MKQYINSLISVLAICVFLAMAWSCIPSKEKITKAKNCDLFIPTKAKNQEIVFKVFDQQTKLPIINARSDSEFFYYRKFMDDTLCTIKFDKSLRSFQITDANGIIKNSNNNLYYSSEDYINVDVTISKEGYYTKSEFRKLYYDQAQLIVNLYLLKSDIQP